MSRKPCLLSFAGFDPSGGAGILADLAVFNALGCRGMAVATALTAQNSQGVSSWEPVAPELLQHQLRALVADFSFAGVKLGMLGRASAIAAWLEVWEPAKFGFLLLDPLIFSSSGLALLDPAAQALLVQKIFPFVDLLTPNLPEGEALTKIKLPSPGGANSPEFSEALLQMGEALLALGPKAVLLKGGHGQGPAVDYLFRPGQRQAFSLPRLSGPSPHGTGCHLSSAILARLSLGDSLPEAVSRAKGLLSAWMQNAQSLGQGNPYLFPF